MDATGRYDLHELLRQYAQEKLTKAGEISNTTQRHLAYFMKLAEAGETHAYGREQVIWYDRLEVEMDNLRAALAWSLSNERNRDRAADRWGAAVGLGDAWAPGRRGGLVHETPCEPQ